MLRAQPRDAEWPKRQDIFAQQFGVRQARQQERIGPHQDAGAHAGERAPRGAVAPDQSAEEGRRKLRHRREREQADRGKLRLSGEAIIEIGEHENEEDRDPPHREQDRSDVLASGQNCFAPPQHERHNDIVRRHDGERDRLDDHHRGRSRQAADERDQRQYLVSARERKRENIHVTVDAAARQREHAGDRDRDHEQVDQHQVDRKQPRGAADFGFASVLHHRHMELARQQHDRHGGEQRHGDERAPHRLARQHGRGVRRLHRLGEQRHRAVEHHEGDDDADRHEGDELDDGLGRDREDQPVLMLGRVDVARAEQHRERRHRHRDEQRDVAEHRLRDAGGHVEMRQDRAERGRHGLELERDVGDRSDDRDQRDRRGDRLMLAVARRDEVRDRGDVLRLGDPHDVQDERRGEPDHQHRADIDGEEVVARPRGKPDRAEERPGGAVDRKRERIDHHPRAARAVAHARVVAIARDDEQQPDVAEGYDDEDPALQHGLSHHRSRHSVHENRAILPLRRKRWVAICAQVGLTFAAVQGGDDA